jgi:hypothetical protein
VTELFNVDLLRIVVDPDVEEKKKSKVGVIGFVGTTGADTVTIYTPEFIVDLGLGQRASDTSQ